jgi:LEA14-like dessication related protein
MNYLAQKKMRLTTLLLTVALLTFSCKKPQGFEYRDLKNFKVSNWGFDKSRVSMDIVYFNPNSFGVELRKVDADIYINNNYVGKFLLDTLMRIDKRSEFALPANIDVDMKNIFKNSLNVLFSKEVLVGAKGSTRVGKSGIFITVPFNYEGRHKVDLF